MRQSREIALKAAGHGNVVSYAFLGNATPDVHAADSDNAGEGSMKRIVQYARQGISLSQEIYISPDDVVLVAGQRELAWLRLVNTDADSREITRFDSAKAEEVLFRPTPFHDWEGISEMPGWVAHNESLKLMPESPTPNMLAVLMMLKLISMAQLTMHAPGIVIAFARRLQKQQAGDAVSYISLEDFLASFGGHMDEGLSKLVTGNELTPEGLGLMPAAKQVVDAILHHAETVVGTYLRKSELVHCVHNGAGAEADGKLWLTATGTDDGKLVGRLPHAVNRTTLHTEFRKAGKDRKTWCKEYNHQFRRFVTGFTTGVVDANLYHAYISLSFMSYGHALPAGSLQTKSTETAQAVTAGSSAPFGTIQRRVLVDPKKSDTSTGRSDLVMVLEKWSNINTDAYTPSTFWSVVSWCGSTQADLDTAPLLLDRSEKMSHTSTTSASLSRPCFPSALETMEAPSRTTELTSSTACSGPLCSCPATLRAMPSKSCASSRSPTRTSSRPLCCCSQRSTSSTSSITTTTTIAATRLHPLP